MRRFRLVRQLVSCMYRIQYRGNVSPVAGTVAEVHNVPVAAGFVGLVSLRARMFFFAPTRLAAQ